MCQVDAVLQQCHHDEKNTIESEVRAVDALKKEMESKCVCCEFSSKVEFEKAIAKALQTK